MVSTNLWRALRYALLSLACLLCLCAQISGVLSVAPPAKVFAKPGSTVDAKISVLLQPGYHTNSNTPSEDYLIPLRLTWTPGSLEAAEVVFPKPHMEKYSFS